LGICNSQPYEIIEYHILPIYESDDENKNWKSKDAKTLLGYIRYIKEHFQDYEKERDRRLNANKRDWEKKEDPLKRLKNSLYIRTYKMIGGTNDYDHPGSIYLPKTYGNKNDLESLFEGIEDIEDIDFVHREYIDEIIKKYRQKKRKSKKGKTGLRKKGEEEIKEWREFFVKLGVNEGLKVEKTNESYLTEEDKERLRDQSRRTYEEITDYKLTPLQPILEKINKNQLLLLC